MILIENPAARLLAILEKGKTIAGDQHCRTAWNKILGTEALSDKFLLSRLAKVIELPSQTSDLLELLDISEKHKSANQHWINQVNTGFMNQKLNGQWSEFINLIDGHTINYLAMTSEFLEMKSTINSDTPQELSEIKSAFQNLLDNILVNEELDKDVKRYLVRNLQRIIVAIDEHFISGYTPIIEAMETTIGYAVLDSRTTEKKVATAFYDTGMAKEFFTALNIISALVTVVMGVPQLSTDLFQSLLPLLKD